MTPADSSGISWREGLLTRVGFVYAAIFVASVVLSLLLMRVTALLWFGLILGLAQLLSVFLNKRGVRPRVRAWVMISALVGACAAFYLFAGLNPGPVLAFAFALVLTTLLLGRTALFGVLLLMVVFLMGIAAAMWLGIWQGPMPAVIGVPTPDVWFWTTVVSALFWAGICFSVLYVVDALRRNVEHLREKEVQRREAEKARFEAEEMAAQSQKLEALGQLAAGIAHDFNNVLLVLRGWTDILKDSDTPELRQQANIAIDQAIDQGEQLSAQLLTFGRKQNRSPRYLSIAAVVDNTGKTLSRVVPSGVALRVEVKPSGFIYADEGQLQQVMLNLVINARDALPDGGDITVRGRPANATETAGLPSAEGQKWVLLEVEDNGMGMDADTRKRIFEPFFTTKEVGKGTGLGLATVFGIVEQSNAHIRVWSEPGKGARFSILFPSFDIAAETKAKGNGKKVVEKNGVRIMVLEDDPLARDLLVFALEQNQFSLVVAATGDEAIALLGREEQPIDILSADAVFPGASLQDVIAAFEASNPGGKVLICSGNVRDDIVVHGLQSGIYEYLPKPFTPEQLVAKISTMLA